MDLFGAALSALVSFFARAEQPGLEVHILATRSPLLDRQVALFLDIDGTLLDIAPTPAEVRVPDGIGQALALARDLLGGALAVVSGRAIADIDRLFSPLRLAAAGQHGAELRPDPGSVAVQVEAVPIGATARAAVAEIAREHPDVILEDKGAAMALHFRRAPNLGDELGRRLRAVVAAQGNGLCLQPGRMVWEIKSCGCSKATAVRALMEQAPFSGRRPVFVGDDASDEDGFAEVERRGGLALAVAGEHRGAREPAFADPAAVRRWLIELPQRIGP